ncbi:MAG: class I SAM-dependent methyltransferase [Hyphomicrobiaceae bacterium]
MAVPSTFLATDGAGYELQMGRWSRRLAPRFIAFSGAAGAGSVLDVGCGTGSLIATLALDRTHRKLQGIDASPAYVDYALSSLSDPRVRIEVGDVCALPFPDGEFDCTLAMLMLQFIPNTALALGEMRRVTRPGGMIAAAVWDVRGGVTFMRLFWDTAAMIDPEAARRRARTYCRPASAVGALSQAFNAAGLQAVAEGEFTIRTDFASFEDYWAPIEGEDGPIAEYARSLSPSVRAALKDKVRLAYVDGEPDGPRSYCATALVARGTVAA